MSGYQRPCDAWVSASWQDHKDRTPPSSEPGTDYASAYGTPLLAAEAGTVTDVKTTTSGATGRYLAIRLDDGRTVRYLHLSSLTRGIGDRTARGDVIAYSGASGHGSEWGYGAHVHVTLWPGAIWAHPTIDFDAHVGADEPPPPPERDLLVAYSIVPLTDGGIYLVSLVNGTRVRIGDPAHVQILQRVKENNSDDTMLHAELDIANSYIDQFRAPPPPSQQSVLVTPAWVAGIFLGLIGVVEVLRFIVDVVT